MGDHRGVSQDARCQGQVPIENVIGRAFVIVWPSSRWTGLSVPATFDERADAAGAPVAAAPAGIRPADARPGHGDVVLIAANPRICVAIRRVPDGVVGRGDVGSVRD